MLKFIWPAAALIALSVSPAQAVSIAPGQVFEGTYSISAADLQIGSSLQLVSVDGPIQFQQFNLWSGTDRMDPGEGADFRIFEGGDTGQPPAVDVPLFAQGSFSFVGFGSGSTTTLTSGVVQIEATSGSFDLDQLELFGRADVTVRFRGGAPFTTQLVAGAFVQNIQPVSTTPPPPPSNVIPLPASGLLLGSFLAGLMGWRARRRCAM